MMHLLRIYHENAIYIYHTLWDTSLGIRYHI